MASIRHGLIYAAVVLALGAARHADAEPAFDYSIGVQLEHNDNVNLSHDDPVSENILTPEFSFGYKEQGSTITANAAGSLAYRDYLGGTYGGEFRGLLSGLVTWTISPDRFDWVTEDYLGRQPVNVLQSNAPSNQQQTNVFSTGPTLRARFGDALRGRLDLRYTNTHADETTSFNSDRFSAAARLAYLLSPLDNISGSLTASRVRYDETASRPFDYDREDAYVGYERTTRQFKIDAAAGYSVVDPRIQGNHSGPLLRVDARWTPSPANNLGVSAAREFADASQDLIIDPSQIGNLGVGSGRNGAVISPQLYVQKSLGLDYNHIEDRFHVNVAPFWRQIDYLEGEFLSQHSFGYTATFSWLFRPELSLDASTGREHRDYTGLARTDDDKSYALALLWKQTPHWSWSLSASHFVRGSTLDAASYTDNAFILSLIYRR